MTKAVSKKLEVTERALQRIADQTIKKEPVRALVELITNSDDSYKKLERFGIEHDGLIRIAFERSRGYGKFIVTDHAEGMGPEKMDQAVGFYGAETHDFGAGEGGRGFFGAGLKEAILSLGGGFVKTIHNNLYNEAVLNIQKYEREIPKEALQLYKDTMGIQSHGTQVTLTADREGIKIPQFETLKRSLELHYALRDILSSPKRKVQLVEIDSKDEEKNSALLSYVSPKGDKIVEKEYTPEEYKDTTMKLEIFKSVEELTGREEGYMRQNGILIASDGAIHDISLFKFEGEEFAQNLFGRLTCDYIDTLLRKGETIVRDSRDGLDWNHSLSRALSNFAEEELEEYISKEKKKIQDKEKPITNDAVKKKFEKAVQKLNSIAKTELKELMGVGKGQETGSMLPPNNFDFVPNYYHVLVGQKSTLTLKIHKSLYKKERQIVKISSSSPLIKVLTPEIEMPRPDSAVSVAHAYIEGKQIGEEGRIMAIAGDLKTEAMVHVVSQRKKTTGRKKRRHRGMFNDIVYSSQADPNMRVRFDGHTGTILIATSAPSVKMYLGPNGEGQEKPETQVMTAELVTQAFCREVAKLRIQGGAEAGVGEPEEVLNSVYNKLVSKYAHIIHTALVS